MGAERSPGAAGPGVARDALRMALRVGIIAAVVGAVVAVELTSRSGVAWRLITFTYQANVLAAAYYAWTLVSPAADVRHGLRGAVVLYTAVAGLVWNLFLTGHSMGYTPANFLLHVVVPALALADWVLIRPAATGVGWRQPLLWLGYPAAYGIAALLVLNALGRRAPYYFLDPATVGAQAVALNCLLLLGGFLVLGYALVAVVRPRTG